MLCDLLRDGVTVIAKGVSKGPLRHIVGGASECPTQTKQSGICVPLQVLGALVLKQISQMVPQGG